MADAIFCQIQVKGHLSDQWTDWFGGLEIETLPQGETIFSGPLPDQAALYGVLNQMRDFGLALVSLSCVELTANQNPHRVESKKSGRDDDARNQSQAQ